jgi:hypothetical protein
MTTSSNLFNLSCLCFSDETIECFRFNGDVALSRAIYREEYHAIIVDAASGIDAMCALFARRERVVTETTPVNSTCHTARLQ